MPQMRARTQHNHVRNTQIPYWRKTILLPGIKMQILCNRRHQETIQKKEVMSNTHNTSKAMKEDFVPFEIAKKLKEKGFREECLAYYDVNDNVGLLYNTQYSDDIIPCQYTDLLASHNIGDGRLPDDSEYCVDAPTIAQALKWLREEKKIIVTIRYLRAEEGDWDFFAEGINGEIWYCSIISYKNYEESALEGIEYALDYLI